MGSAYVPASVVTTNYVGVTNVPNPTLLLKLDGYWKYAFGAAQAPQNYLAGSSQLLLAANVGNGNEPSNLYNIGQYIKFSGYNGRYLVTNRFTTVNAVDQYNNPTLWSHYINISPALPYTIPQGTEFFRNGVQQTYTAGGFVYPAGVRINYAGGYKNFFPTVDASGNVYIACHTIAYGEDLGLHELINAEVLVIG